VDRFSPEWRDKMNQSKSRPIEALVIIIGQNTFYHVDRIASILQIPITIAKFIVDANWEITEDEAPGAPMDCLLERQVLALQEPSHRFALDLATFILPFHPRLAEEIATDLPGSPDYIIEGEIINRYQSERINSGIPAVLRSINPNIPSPRTLDGLLRPRQVAEILGVSLQKVAKLANDGFLKHEVTGGGHRRFRFKDVKQYKIEQSLRNSDEPFEAE
jgi:excisionase family DNA binding protein